MLQSDVVQIQERRSHVPKVDEQNIRIANYKECASLHGRHVGKKHMGGRQLERPPRDLRHLLVIQLETKSKQMCVRGDDRKVPQIHGIPKGYRGQRRSRKYSA